MKLFFNIYIMALKVIQIATKDHFSLALLEDGTVIGWGSNRYGEINIPDFGGKKVIQITCGYIQAYAILEDGTVVGWGCENSKNIPDFGGRKAKQISSGKSHALVLLEDGNVIHWTFTGPWSGYPPKIISPDFKGLKAIHISCHNHYSLIVLENGEFRGIDMSNERIVRFPYFPEKKIKQISTGDDYVLILFEDGIVKKWDYIFGEKEIPDTVGSRRVIQITTSHAHSVVLFDNGGFLIWGSWTAREKIPKLNQKVKQISAGAYFTVALLENGKVITWGGVDEGPGTIPDYIVEKLPLPVPPYNSFIPDYEMQIEPTLENYQALKRKFECRQCRVNLKKVLLNCNHAFCETCSTGLINCPICRGVVGEKTVLRNKYYKY